ncbi:MAG: sugar ABC transporter permease [bacterium]|nr:sugar ABC transporter permease [bacterium]
MSSTAKQPASSSYQHVESRSVMSQRERIFTLTFRFTIIGIAIFFALYPVIYVISAAFNPLGTLSTRSLIPQGIDEFSDLFTNFRTLLVDEIEIFPFWNWLFNSILVATISTTLSVLVCALAAYSFSRFRFNGRRSLLLGILLIQVFPNLLSFVALFLMLQQIGRLADVIPQALPFLSFIDWGFLRLFGLDSLGGLILVYLGGAMGINTWLMKGFFDTIPRDIDESAMVDGATHDQTFWMLIFPLVRPILAVVGVLSFVGTFNEFVLARFLLRDNDNFTLMVGLFSFVSAEFSQNWGKFAAGSLIAATPIVIVYLLLQDQIVGGLTQGAVKG